MQFGHGEDFVASSSLTATCVSNPQSVHFAVTVNSGIPIFFAMTRSPVDGGIISCIANL